MIRLLALLALLPCAAGAACTEPWVQQDTLADATKYNGYQLESWGLNLQGNMEELYLHPDKGWVVVETSPGRCSRLLSQPTEYMGRLAKPTNDTDMMYPGPLQSGQGV